MFRRPSNTIEFGGYAPALAVRLAEFCGASRLDHDTVPAGFGSSCVT
jgi:hypothetical protein